MRVFKYISILVVVFGLIFQTNAETYLKEGLELEEQGQPIEALKLWDDAVQTLEYPSVAIATEYLRIAAEYKITDYYQSATSIYMDQITGSEGTDFHYNRSELEREIQRLRPILDEEDFHTYQQMIEDRDPILFTKISNFWKSIDPTPDTIYNERLLEHWQRIIHAKKSFNNEDEEPYGTDIRSEFYLKYGEPDKLEKGRVRITYDEIQTVLNQLMPASHPESSGNNFALMKVANQIQNLFVNPEYEVWIYNTPEDMTENMVLIFGHRSGGKFERLLTLEEFIPESAFGLKVQSSFDTGIAPVPAGMVLQWIYYEHFAKIDPYFARLFSEFYSTIQVYKVDTESPPDPMAMRLIKQQNLTSAFQTYRRVPEKFSTEEKKIPEIPIKIYQYRMLDEMYQPVFITFMESHPLEAFLEDFTSNRDMRSGSDSLQKNIESENWYDLIHGIQLRDEDWNILAETHQKPDLIFNPDEPFISSVFEIPWGAEDINQVFYAKLTNSHAESKPRSQSVFSDSIRGLGKYQIQQPAPLEVEAGKMAMSDLIIGYQKIDQPQSESFFDFVVANDRRIPENENLIIHFELYELETDRAGMAHFELEYEIKPKNGLLDWTRKKSEDFNIILTFDNFGDRFAESLEIEAEGLIIDEYELTWTVRDLESGRTQEEILEFEVFETSKSILSTNSED